MGGFGSDSGVWWFMCGVHVRVHVRVGLVEMREGGLFHVWEGGLFLFGGGLVVGSSGVGGDVQVRGAWFRCGECWFRWGFVLAQAVGVFHAGDVSVGQICGVVQVVEGGKWAKVEMGVSREQIGKR